MSLVKGGIMLAKYFMLPLLGALYASGWWAWAFFWHGTDNEPIALLLVILGIIWGALILASFVEDLQNN